MNALRQKVGQTAPAAYASAAPASPNQAVTPPAVTPEYPGQNERIEAPALPNANNPSPSPTQTPSPTPTPTASTSPETASTTTPPSPPNTGTETGDYTAGQESTKQSEREAKYPSSEWPTNLWK